MRAAIRRVGWRSRSLLAAIPLLALSVPATPVHAATVGDVQTYIVTYKDGASSSAAGALIQGAGGQLVYNYSQIGVVIARSADSSFRANVMKDSRVEGASSTAGFATQLNDGQTVQGSDAEGPPPGAPVNGASSMAVGEANYIQVDLTPGEYGFICFVPDTG